MMLEDNDYIYNIFIVESGEGQIAQITRHDKYRYVTREEWEKSYTCG